MCSAPAMALPGHAELLLDAMEGVSHRSEPYAPEVPAPPVVVASPRAAQEQPIQEARPRALDTRCPRYTMRCIFYFFVAGFVVIMLLERRG